MDFENVDDRSLVRLAQEARPGDGRAFGELVRRHEGHVRANCRYLTSNDPDVEDLSQEVFVKAYFAVKRFEGRSEFGTWIRRIKVNHCFNHLEARGRRVFVDIDSPVASSGGGLAVEARAPDALDNQDLRGRIDGVLREMPDTLRVPLVLRDMDGLSYDEIATALQVGLSAVKMRIKRGREAFRTAWAALDEVGEH